MPRAESAQQVVATRIRLAFEQHTKVLDLIGLSISTLPSTSPSLAQLDRLRTLHLAYNQLNEVPDEIRSLTGLEELDLSANDLESLPNWIGELSKLRTLRVSSNRLGKLPAGIGRLRSLERLHLSDNRLDSLPTALFGLTELRSLTLAKNKLAGLSPKISALTNLRVLDLFANDLGYLPEELGQLENLEQLNAGENSLQEVPEALASLERLVSVDLSGNGLQSLPRWLKEMNSLSRLMLHGNPDLHLPLSILGPEPKDAPFSESYADAGRILDFYFTSERGSKELNEARMILVGRGNVGKTSLVKRLRENHFAHGEPRTEGIAIDEWYPFSGDTQTVLHVWDFGGQEILHGTHQLFLTPNCLYLVVVNGREGLEDHDATYWLKLIDSFAGDAPVIVVQNKIREQEFDLPYQQLQENYPQIVGFQKTDCEDEDTIEHLADLIRSAIQERMPFMHSRVPAAWFDVKAALKRLALDYLSYEHFRQLCSGHGVFEAHEQDNLALVLHLLGVALNFKDDPRLRETSVLDPKWVTEGVYHLLTHPELARRYGDLRLADLQRWLSPDRYPRAKHLFLIELMSRFRLCFRYSDQHDRYLVPELLRKDRPKLGERFETAHCTNFEYHYPIFPEGLIAQFIVRTQTLSEDQPNLRWRNGVVVSWGEAEALVEADLVQRHVAVRVAGLRTQDRLRLLAVLRAEFERIHRKIPHLDVGEYVALPAYPQTHVRYQDFILYERKGYEMIPLNVGNEVVSQNVSALLNVVDYGGVHSRYQRTEAVDRALSVFISYAAEDAHYEKQLEQHLKILEWTGLISVCSAHHITPTAPDSRVADPSIANAHIILLLVSAAFLDAQLQNDSDLQTAMKRHSAGLARVIPILVRSCGWKLAPFGKLKPLPTSDKPVALWRRPDDAWVKVVDGIQNVIRKCAQNIDHCDGSVSPNKTGFFLRGLRKRFTDR